MRKILSAWRAVVVLAAAAWLGLAAGQPARAQSAIPVDHPQVLVVAFDYDGLAVPPQVTTIRFVLYSDGTFALMEQPDGRAVDKAEFVQGRLPGDQALQFAKSTHADLQTAGSKVGQLADLGSKGGFEVWYWNPADRLYWHPILTGHPCDAGADPATANSGGIEAFCRLMEGLQRQSVVQHHPVRTSFIFVKSALPATQTRPIPKSLNAVQLDDRQPMVGICVDDDQSYAQMAELTAPSDDTSGVAYRFGELEPLALEQVVRATYLPGTVEVPLGDVIESVGDPCNIIRGEK